MRKFISKAVRTCLDFLSPTTLTDAKEAQSKTIYKDELIEIVQLFTVGGLSANCMAVKDLTTSEVTIWECRSKLPNSEDISLCLFNKEVLQLEKKTIHMPDMKWLADNWNNICGFFISHSHSDHCMALPEVFGRIHLEKKGPRIDPEVFCSEFTKVFLEHHFEREEYENIKMPKINVIEEGKTICAGSFKITPFEVPHSIPGTFSFIIETAGKTLVFMSDFKFRLHKLNDKTAFEEKLKKIAEKRQIDILIMECLNIGRPGMTDYEAKVFENLKKILQQNENKRVFFTCIASNLFRIKKVIELCNEMGKNFVLLGQSLRTIIEIGQKMKLIPDFDLDDQPQSRNNCYLVGGSQGEIGSAMQRLGANEYGKFKIGKGDAVVISQSIIPGNEDHVKKTVMGLLDLGAIVYMPENIVINLAEDDPRHERLIYTDVHVSGHECEDGLKKLVSIFTPSVIIPYHGLMWHYHKFAEKVREWGYRIISLTHYEKRAA